jgi:alkylated DNA repair dioxygenase AlkB
MSEAAGSEARRIELAPGAFLRFWEAFLSSEEADRALRVVLVEVPWTQGHVRIAGKTYAEPRLTAWMGDPGARYTYTGRPLEPLAWSPRVADLRARVEELSGARFNSVLLNRYRDGQDSMGLHADDEPELGPDPIIVSLSLGATRRFVLKPRAPGSGGLELDLTHGSLLAMEGTTQRLYKHALPKRAAASVGERVNLTFRRIVTIAP